MKLLNLSKAMAALLAVLILSSLFGCKVEKIPNSSSGEISSESSEESSLPSQNGEIVRKDIGNMISYAVSSLPETIDPAMVLSSSLDAQFVYHTSDGLLRMYNDKAVPSIAEKYETEDNITFTFYIREAYWEDAVRITADDFYYVFRRILDRSSTQSVPEEVLMIKNAMAYRAGNAGADELGIKVVDKKTLEITLEEANPLFIDLLAADTQVYLVRKDILYACGESFAKSAGTYLSCGPYRLQSWTDEEIVLQKNPMYWDSSNVTLESIRCMLVKDGATRAALYDSGECNAYVELLSSNREKYADAKLMKENTLVSLGLNFDSALLANDNFRKALYYAIDREELASKFSGISYCTAERFIPKNLFAGYDYDVSFTATPKADPTKAGEYLSAALQELETNAESLPELVFVSADTATAKKTTESIVNMLRNNLGLTNIRVSYVTSEKAVEYYCSGNYDMYVLSNNASCASPIWHLEKWKTNSIYNVSGFTSETFDNYDLFTNTMEAEELLIAYAPEIPLYYRGFLYGASENVSGIGVSSAGVKLQFQYAKVSNIENNS